MQERDPEFKLQLECLWEHFSEGVNDYIVKQLTTLGIDMLGCIASENLSETAMAFRAREADIRLHIIKIVTTPSPFDHTKLKGFEPWEFLNRQSILILNCVDVSKFKGSNVV